MLRTCLLALVLGLASTVAWAGDAPANAPAFDAELAKKTGADEHGMRSYVLVILRTGPKRMPDGAGRDAMFAGHFANMDRLAKEGKLALAGPFAKDPDGWRGLFVFAVEGIDEAKALTETDPVIANGEMVADYHAWYG
ncbi:MAG TPA: YciI family protein, partial [Lysobacter sp.]|nr:YciI family protein [Lysobacter sp.]